MSSPLDRLMQRSHAVQLASSQSVPEILEDESLEEHGTALNATIRNHFSNIAERHRTTKMDATRGQRNRAKNII